MSSPAIQPRKNFEATWKSMPESLRPPELSTADKVGQVAWNVFSVIIPIIGLARLAAYGIGRLGRYLILPAINRDKIKDGVWTEYFFNPLCKKMCSHFEITPYTVTTPDGAKLDATVFKHPKATAQTPTTIYFQGNAAIMHHCGWEWLLRESINKNIPQNFIVFDYRSVGLSTGEFNVAKDLIIDGSSIAQLVRQEVQTSADKVDFYGVSIGGAIALKTKAANEILTGKFLSERSLSSFSDVVKAWTVNLHWILQPIVSLAISILKNQDLELDAAADLEKIKGKSFFVYHREDNVIPLDASISQKAPKKDILELTGVDLDKGDNHHNHPLRDYDEFKQVADFVFA